MDIENRGRRSKSRVTLLDRLIGKQIRTARIAKGISQTELANQCETSFQQIQKYEGGINRISASRLFVVAQTLDLPIMYFFDQTAAQAGDYGTNTRDRELLEFSKVARRVPPEIRHTMHELMRAVGRTSSGAGMQGSVRRLRNRRR